MPKVLIIESDEGARYLYDIALKFQKLEVVTAETMSKGLEVIKKSQPDLVLLDQMVPDLDNVNLIAKLEEIVPDKLPIIIVTNLSDEGHIHKEEVRILKAFEYLVAGKHTVGDVIRSSRRAVNL